MRVCGRCANVLTNEKKQDNARSHSDIVEVSENGHVVIGVRIVQCHHAIMDVVIGARITQCYHATKPNSDFSTFGPNFIMVPISTCSQFQLVVRLYELIVTFPCSHFLHTFAPRNMSFEVLCLHLPSVTVDRRQL